MKQAIIVQAIDSVEHIFGEIDLYRADLIAEGWETRYTTVDNDRDISEIKGLIKTIYDPSATETAIILVGHVPVPKSYISSRPDGHGTYGVAPADWFYGNMTYDMPTREIEGKTLLDGYWTMKPECSVGRIDFRNIKFKDGVNDDEWEIAAYKNYFKKLHEYRVSATTPVSAIAAHADGEGSWSMGLLKQIFRTDSVETATVISEQIDSWVPAGSPPSNPYRMGLVAPRTLSSATDKIDATFLQMYRSFRWLNHKPINGKPTPWGAVDGPRLRYLLATKPHMLATLWSDTIPDPTTLRAGGTLGEAIRKSRSMQMVSLSLQGDPTLRLFV